MKTARGKFLELLYIHKAVKTPSVRVIYKLITSSLWSSLQTSLLACPLVCGQCDSRVE